MPSPRPPPEACGELYVPTYAKTGVPGDAGRVWRTCAMTGAAATVAMPFRKTRRDVTGSSPSKAPATLLARAGRCARGPDQREDPQVLNGPRRCVLGARRQAHANEL